MSPTPTQATLLDGKALAKTLQTRLADDIATFKTDTGVTPGLTVVRVGEDPASVVYVNKKAKTADTLGIHSQLKIFPENTSQDELLSTIDALNADPAVHAILVQLPLPKHIDEQTILQRVAPAKDVDGFHPINLGRLLMGDLPAALPCTPAGMMTMLAEYRIPIQGQHAVVVGRSTIVGKPMGLLLLQAHATVTYCHSRTRDLGAITRQADILVAAVGKPGIITAEMVKPGATVLDVGINRVNGNLVGDVDFDRVQRVAGAITPVPGGVGPLTISTLMANTLALAKAQTQALS